jgi:hypothetical protein
MKFDHPQVAEKFIPKLEKDVKIATTGYHGPLSRITPNAANKLAKRDNPYITAKTEDKKAKGAGDSKQ